MSLFVSEVVHLSVSVWVDESERSIMAFAEFCRFFIRIPNTLIANVAFIGEISTTMVVFPLGLIGTKALLLYHKSVLFLIIYFACFK